MYKRYEKFSTGIEVAILRFKYVWLKCIWYQAPTLDSNLLIDATPRSHLHGSRTISDKAQSEPEMTQEVAALSNKPDISKSKTFYAYSSRH